jgi:type IV pilus assembly protein PilO
MRKNFDLGAIKQKLKPPLLSRRVGSRDPRAVVRAALVMLLAGNLIATWFVFRPWGGSAEELELRLSGLRKELIQKRVALERVRILAAKIEKGKKEGDIFIGANFFDRRTAYSTLLEELNQVAKSAGIKPRDHAYNFEPVEGSDTLGMLTVTANMEGTYADLMKVVNQLDKSKRFLIVESLAAAPLQSGGTLSISLKLNTFVQEGAVEAPAAEAATGASE